MERATKVLEDVFRAKEEAKREQKKETPDQRPAADDRRDRPAKVFDNGRVVTRVWANRTAWGEVDWSVDQVRVFSRQNSRHTHSFQGEDLMDAMRGLNRARSWVRRRGPWWKRLVPFM